jgi:ABC-type uncharacterized transport system substrate-binding protein
MRQFRIADFEFRIGPRVIFIVAFALGLLTAPVPSPGQQPGKLYRIGWLGTTTGGVETDPQHCPIKGNPNWQAWVEGLREHGYLPGQNLVIECRYTEEREARAPALAAELVSLKPDLIVTVGAPNTRAAKQATSTLPIVTVVIDPVGLGLVASLAHPGGNVTGLADDPPQIEGKRLQLLKEAAPKVSRVAVLDRVSGTPEPRFEREREAAARALGVTLQALIVREPKELEGAFAAMTKAGAEALFMAPNAFWWPHRQRIIALAAQSRLPAIYHNRDYVEAGGLMSYAVNNPAIRRRLGFYVDKILKGATPADLPVEQPTKFELVINLKTAKSLALTIPPSLLMRADEVIQ